MTTLQPPRASVWGQIWPFHARAPSADDGIVDRIKQLAESESKLSDRELLICSDELKQLAAQSTDITGSDVLIPSFALVAEAVRRTLGIEYYDVQFAAGATLARSRIAEMQTGEGKTVVAALPAFLQALAGRGVHVMTVNAYLAQRDFEQLSPLYHLLGMSVGLLEPQAAPSEKKNAYRCDITYGPGYEFGFDYLRDQAALLAQPKPPLGESYQGMLKGRRPARVESIQRGHAFAIIDEVDSILIDEAGSPLVLSGGSPHDRQDIVPYDRARQMAADFRVEEDFSIDFADGTLKLTQRGTKKAYGALDTVTRQHLRRPWATYVEQALRAAHLLRKDVDYIVDNQKVQLVDQSTGRIFSDRSWRGGLHQAVEVNEGVEPTAEHDPIARISRQQFFRLYEKICGMTGTATGSEAEFREFYRLEVVAIPLNRPCHRQDLPTKYFADQAAKWAGIIDDVVEVHHTGRPVLIGTRTIDVSQELARLLDDRQVPYRLLNGKQDMDEAMIVAHAGEQGAVTLATNMAGRGTDIRLGKGVAKLGGLHVVATERHESRRVDRQLVGRAARQGDPGSCRFFMSAEDPLVIKFAPRLAKQMKRRAAAEASEDPFSRQIRRLQIRVERLNFAKRRQLFSHEHWLEDVLSKLANET